MRKVILFLFLLFISNSVFATTKESALASCILGVGSSTGYCVDEPDFTRFHRFRADGYSLAVYSYNSLTECNDGAKSFNNVTRACYLPPTCTAPAVLTLNTTTGYKTCTSPDVTCPDGSTAPTLAECPHTCDPPTLSTEGITQLLKWSKWDPVLKACVPDGFGCDAPTVVNQTTKKCDLKCSDGSTVDQSSGAQCPPPRCEPEIHGSMVIKKTFNTVTQACENSDILRCDSQLQEPSKTGGGACLPKSGAKDCGNHIVVMDPTPCKAPKDDSEYIVCKNGLKILPPRVCSELPPDPKDCPGGASNVQTTGFVFGVGTCILKDGTQVASSGGSSGGADGGSSGGADGGSGGGQDQPNDKYNPQEYAKGVACTSNYAYPCDPTLPLINLPNQKCGPGTFFICADQNDKPVVPDLFAKPTESTTTESPQVTETTTKQNPDGTTTTTTHVPGTTSETRTNADGSTTTTTTVPGNKSTTECPDCAKESTLREAVDRLGSIAKNLSSNGGIGNYSSSANTTEQGNFNDSILGAQAALDENKDALTAKMAEVKTGVSSLLSNSVSGGGGSLPTIDLGNMKGVNVSQDLNKFSPELSVVGTIIIAMAWVMALSITLSR